MSDFHRLTDEDRLFLERIKNFMLKNGYAPALDDICKLTNTTSRQRDRIMRKLGRLGIWEYKGKASAIVIPGMEYTERK